MLTSICSLVFLASLTFSKCHVVPNQEDHGDQSPHTPCNCNDNYEPVCGKDSLSYNSPCLAFCANVVVACYGKCPCSAKSCEDSTGTHLDGESWQCEDVCNACFCSNVLQRRCVQFSTPCMDSTISHLRGESWLCEDGCNTCICRNGVISSSKMLCPVIKTSKSCLDKTGSHPDGESWLCEDGCNTCSCINGVVSSTEKACQKSCEDTTGTYLDGESWRCADGCNRCSCRNGQISSTRRMCPQSTPSPSDCACSREFNPVCGEDQKQYANECLALCNGTNSECEGSCPCPEEEGNKKKDGMGRFKELTRLLCINRVNLF